METFDITRDLEPGITLLEASAGTGKTWTIAALVTKYVAAGEVALDEMLVVTFTRAASQELRERVRAASSTRRCRCSPIPSREPRTTASMTGC